MRKISEGRAVASQSSVKPNEVDILWEYLPSVFEVATLPSSWDDEWIAVSIGSPETAAAEGDLEALLFAPTDAPLAGLGRRVDFSHNLPQELSGHFPGALQKNWSSPYPPPDAFGFYLPFHYFYPRWWGIYLLAEGVVELGRLLYGISDGKLTEADSMVVSRVFLFGHEQYHHSVESMATRLEITHRLPIYKSGFEAFYQHTALTDAWLEEALANAHGYRRVKKVFGRAKWNIIEGPLRGYISGCPPGYRKGLDYVTDSEFKEGEAELAEGGHKASHLATPEAHERLWTAFGHGFHPFRKRGSHVVYLVHSGSPLSERAGLAGRFLRYRELAIRLKESGCSFERQGKGSHEIWRNQSGDTFSVPRHPGDLKRGTLSGILKQAGLQMGVEEFLHPVAT